MIQNRVDMDFYNGVYIDVSFMGNPIAGCLIREDGEIKSIWEKESHIDLFPLFEIALQRSIINGKINPTTGSLFTFMRNGDKRIEFFKKRNWQHDKTGEWERYSIKVTDLLSK